MKIIFTKVIDTKFNDKFYQRAVNFAAKSLFAVGLFRVLELLLELPELLSQIRQSFPVLADLGDDRLEAVDEPQTVDQLDLVIVLDPLNLRRKISFVELARPTLSTLL